MRAMVVDREIQAAVDKGIITPAQRGHFEKIALSDIETFREIVKTMKPQVDLTEHGTGGGAAEGGDLQKVSVQLNELTRAKMASDNKLNYGAAFRLVLSEHPELAKRHEDLTRQAVRARE